MSPSNLLEAMGEHPKLYEYLPDKRGKTYRVDRNFIRTIIAKIEPEFWEKVSTRAHDIRHEFGDNGDKIDTITMDKKLHD